MYDKFFAYLDSLDKSFIKLAGLLHEKLAALDRFDPDTLDEIVKEEQVYTLKSKGFESQIKNFRQQLKLSGETLSEVIAELPEEEKQRFEDVFLRLSTSLEVVRELNQKCQDLTENRLHQIDKALKDVDKSKGTSYSEIRNSDDAPKLMNKSI